MKFSSKLFYIFICVNLMLILAGVQPVYAAGLVVNTDADNTIDDGLCTLREAITTANNDSDINTGDCTAGSGADTITFAANYTITLSGSQLPVISTNITINGNGVSQTIIQANVNPNTATYRVLEVVDSGNLTLNNITIRHGRCNGSCSTDGTAGSGIYNAGTLTVNNSEISDNSATYGGGGIFSISGVLTITDSSLSYNTTANYGGGIFASGGTVTLTNSTIFYNSTTWAGGGIYNIGALWTITNTTFSDNTSSFYGGGIYNYIGTLTVTNSTITRNMASTIGGNISNSNNGTIFLFNSIIANNWHGTDCNNLGTLVAGSFNIDTDGTCDNATQTTTLELNLVQLRDNGGATPTHALGPGSVAIDVGDDTVCAAAPVNYLDQRGTSRPQGAGCDIGAYEKVDESDFPTFADVPTNAFAWAQIESIYAAGITGGCSTNPLNYCPSGQVTRAQMAVFLLRGIHGSSYSPPAATGIVFNDVAINSFAAAYIEAFANEAITGGCGGGNYCATNPVTRAQMAVFLLKAKHGSGYTPPAATGTMFNDVAINSFAAAWIEQLAAEGITGGCGSGNYCPNASVTRAQMAVFLQKTFNLPLP